jgi:hypothetical protein
LRAAVRAGHVRPEQKLAICSGGVSLAPEDRVELLTVLASDSDGAISERAKNVALSQPLASYIAALTRADADARLFAYCGANLGDKPGVADAMAKNPGCPASVLAHVARHLTSEGIQTLLNHVERFTEHPNLVGAVSKCTRATAAQREVLDDLQKGAMPAEELEKAAEEAEPDAVKRKTLMQKLAFMTVVQRLTLALKGGREERMLLIRDSNKLVQKCVLQSPRLSETEVEHFAAMANLTGEILRAISLNRAFMKNYTVARNLIFNPKTPLDVSLHLFPRLTPTDLTKLAANKNVPDTLRSMAHKLVQKRKRGGAGA